GQLHLPGGGGPGGHGGPRPVVGGQPAHLPGPDHPRPLLPAAAAARGRRGQAARCVRRPRRRCVVTQQPRTRSGRHASTSTRRDPQLIAIVVVVALVAVLALGFLVTRPIGGDGAAADDDPDIVQAADGDSSGCETTTRVDVVADPAISTAVASALAPLANSPSCIDAQVAAQASDLAADTISRPEGVGLGGSLPDV